MDNPRAPDPRRPLRVNIEPGDMNKMNKHRVDLSASFRYFIAVSAVLTVSQLRTMLICCTVVI